MVAVLFVQFFFSNLNLSRQKFMSFACSCSSNCAKIFQVQAITVIEKFRLVESFHHKNDKFHSVSFFALYRLF